MAFDMLMPGETAIPFLISIAHPAFAKIAAKDFYEPF
jgi:hypothetical protein